MSLEFMDLFAGGGFKWTWGARIASAFACKCSLITDEYSIGVSHIRTFFTVLCKNALRWHLTRDMIAHQSEPRFPLCEIWVAPPQDGRVLQQHWHSSHGLPTTTTTERRMPSPPLSTGTWMLSRVSWRVRWGSAFACERSKLGSFNRSLPLKLIQYHLDPLSAGTGWISLPLHSPPLLHASAVAVCGASLIHLSLLLLCLVKFTYLV